MELKLSKVIFSGIGFFGFLFGTSPPPSILLGQIEAGQFYSQVQQDKFVYSVLCGLLGKQDQGYYVEIGAGEPVYINNSYFFEKNLEWKGVSIDISENLSERWYKERKNLLLSVDAIRADYSVILKDFPQEIDYLSLDVDGYYDLVLEQLMRAQRVFKVITIEHDFYRFGDLYRQKEREILSELGYYLLCPDVSTNGLAFEDWWIHPHFFPADLFSKLTSINFYAKDYSDIIKEISRIIHGAYSVLE